MKKILIAAATAVAVASSTLTAPAATADTTYWNYGSNQICTVSDRTPEQNKALLAELKRTQDAFNRAKAKFDATDSDDGPAKYAAGKAMLATEKPYGKAVQEYSGCDFPYETYYEQDKKILEEVWADWQRAHKKIAGSTESDWVAFGIVGVVIAAAVGIVAALVPYLQQHPMTTEQKADTALMLALMK